MRKSKRTREPARAPAPAARGAAWLWAAVAMAALGSGCGDEPAASGETLVGIPTEAAVEVGATEGALLVPLIEAIDLGTLTEGAARMVRFPLLSAGTEDASIRSLKASCGCTVAAAYVRTEGGERELVRGEPLAPGTRIEVEVLFDSRGRVGRERKLIDVYGDAVGGRVQLELGVETVPFLEVQPDPLSFDRVFPLAGTERVAEVRSADGEPFDLQLVQTPERGLVVAAEPVGDGAVWRVTATLGPEVHTGPLLSEVVLVTDRPLEAAGPLAELGVPAAVHAAPGGPFNYKVLPVTAVVVAAVEALPPYVPFGFVMPDQLTARTTRVECYDPALTEAFLAAPPAVTFGASEETGWPEGFGEAFSVAATPVRPGAAGARPLTPGATAAWDLELGFLGRRGAGLNRVVGRAEVAFPGAAGEPGVGLPEALQIDFQVILQP